MLESDTTNMMTSENMTLDPKQAAAIELCYDTKKRIVAITGCAGTGKTTIIRNAVKRLTDMGVSVALAAPTGKAAKRIKEATGLEAMTIHRLLEYTHPGEPDENGNPVEVSFPRRDKFNPIDYKVVFVDEYAMVNHELHRNLIDALPPGGAIRAVGDINQLRPIEEVKSLEGKPSPFEQLLAKFDKIELETVYRQGEDSAILEAANRIRKGIIPSKSAEDHSYLVVNAANAVEKLRQLIPRMEEHFGADFRTTQSQVITPMKSRTTGSYTLSVMMQNMYRPSGDRGLLLPRHKWQRTDPITVYVGDKVIWTSNTYDLRDVGDRFEDFENRRGFIEPGPNDMIMNGEMGHVSEIWEDGSLSINLGDRTVFVPAEIRDFSRDGFLFKKDLRPNIELGYAITTHKAQGSEWRHVIYVMDKSSKWMHNRRQFYTAVTRASKACAVITDGATLSAAVRKEM
jgi:exodeoxyribonuclease V alpha subunit